MGASCSRGRNSKSKSDWIAFFGFDALDRVDIVMNLRIRPRQAIEQLPRIAYAIQEIFSPRSWYSQGRCPNRTLVRRFCKDSDGLVYVVDSTNEDKLQEELKRLDKSFLLKDDETQNLVMMILATQHDGEGALSLKQIENKVRETLTSHDPKLGGRTLFLRECNSLTKVGVEEAFDQFTQIIQMRKEGQISPGLQTFMPDDLQTSGKKDDDSLLHSLKKMFDRSYMKSALLY